MDCKVKKQRRRSIRNLRRTATFVPPTVDYGSGWVEENQETNIANLVTSFEELHFNIAEKQGDHPNKVSRHPPNAEYFNLVDEEAQDGFQASHPRISSSHIPETSQHSTDDVTCEDDSRIAASGLAIQTGDLTTRTGHRKNFGSENLGATHNKFVNEDSHNEIISPENNNSNDHNKVASLFRGDVQNSLPTCAEGSKEVTYNESKEPLERKQSENHSINNYTVNYGPQDSSMSPEYTEFDQLAYKAEYDGHCDNSSMNQATTSLIDVSTGSALNTALTAIESLPVTPDYPCFLSTPKMQQTGSDSEIICTPEEPIISSDPDTSLIMSLFHVGDISPGLPIIMESAEDSISSPPCSTMAAGSGSLSSAPYSFINTDNSPISSVSCSAMSSKNSSVSSAPCSTTVSNNGSTAAASNSTVSNDAPQSTIDFKNGSVSSIPCPTVGTSNESSSSAPYSTLDSINASVSHVGLPYCIIDSITSCGSSTQCSAMDSKTCPVPSSTCSTIYSNHGSVSSGPSEDTDSNPLDFDPSGNTDELNNTYNLQSSGFLGNEVKETENSSNQCFETSSLVKEPSRISVGSEKLSVDNCPDASKLMIVDSESKKSKRRSSNFFPDIPISLQLRPSTLVGKTSQNSFEDDPTVDISDSLENSPLTTNLEKVIHQPTVYEVIPEEVEIDSAHVNVEEKKNGKYFGRVDEEDNEQMVEQVQDVSFVEKSCAQVSPRAVLSDCSNQIDSVLPSTLKKTKTKQPRRKSCELTRLIEESCQFLTQTSLREDKGDGMFLDDLSKENDSLENGTLGRQSKPSAPQRVSRSLRKRPGRKSWDFRQDVNSSGSSVSDVTAKGSCSEASEPPHHGKDAVTEGCQDFELQAKAIYSKQPYVHTSPRPLETIKETARGKDVFGKRVLKRYLGFGTASAKEKKREKKALSVYNGRQCFFPITQQDFDRKMLDIQLLLDCDFDC